MDEIRKLAADGWNLRRLSKKYGCSRQCMLDRMREAGIQRLPPYSCPGSRNPAWNGGSYIDGDGYVLIYAPNHPHATKAGRVREHRLVMEKIIGRYLLPGEVVHHKDDNPQNNLPDNLELFPANSEHLRKTLKGKCPNWSPEGLERIRKGLKKYLKNRKKKMAS